MAAKLTDLDGVMSLKAKGLLAFFSSIGTICVKKKQIHRISHQNHLNYCCLLAISTTENPQIFIPQRGMIKSIRHIRHCLGILSTLSQL